MKTSTARPILAYGNAPPRLGPTLTKAARIVSLYPILPLGAAYLSAVAVRLSRGHWPRVYQDVSFIPDGLTDLLLLGSFPMLLVNSLLTAFALVGAIQRRRWRDTMLTALLPLATWGVAAALLWLDPGGVWEWFFD